MLDRAVLAGCIHRLEDEQQRPPVLGVKHVLLLCEPLCASLKEFGRLALLQLQPTGVARIIVLQPKALAFCDPERLNILLDAIEDLFSRHGITSLLGRQSSGPFALLRPILSVRSFANSTRDEWRAEWSQRARSRW